MIGEPTMDSPPLSAIACQSTIQTHGERALAKRLMKEHRNGHSKGNG